MDKQEAEQLWSEIRGGLINTENLIVKAVESRSWEPLGYDTFADCWKDRMKGVKLATEMARVHVVYALMDEGLDNRKIRKTIGTTVGDEALDKLREAHDEDVPPDIATTVVRRHLRQKPRESCMVHVELNHDEVKNYKAVCKMQHLDFQQEAQAALRDWFGAIVVEAAG